MPGTRNLAGVAVVTGGSSGIGEACARELAARGATVAVLDINPAGRAVVDEIGGRFWHCDVGDDKAFEAVAAEVEAAMGPVEYVVNSAGILQKSAMKPRDFPLDAWDDIVRVDQRGTYLSCLYFGERMVKRERGSIVNIASVAGKDGNPNASHYSASKAGLIGLTKSLGKELATKNILVNAVTPAAAKTEIFDSMSQQHIDYMLSKIPMNRFLLPEEAASLILWLSSEDCAFSTGAVFDLSGGRATY